jgi:transcriptional regulator
METTQILQLQVKKHVKIYKLKQAGLTNSQIAKELNTNAGHVYNALKKYSLKPELVKIADEIQ